MEEGDACEQTPKHAQSDSVTTINTLAGGRANVEDGLQTGLDIVATLAWWDWNAESVEADEDEVEAQSDSVLTTGGILIAIAILVATVAVFYFVSNKSKESEFE